MRRPLLAVLIAALVASPIAAIAQSRGGGDEQDRAEQAARKKKDSEWEDKQAPLPSLRNAGPCPFVKVLYDAARYVEMEGAKPASSAVGYSGEIQGVSAGCRYKGSEPIHLEVEVLFALGKGPQAQSQTKAYNYWIAVTDRNRAVLAKQDFSLPVKFPEGQDRVLVTDRIKSIDIPRGGPNVSGANFEVLVGFEVTPEMAEFNRDGKRFRVNAGTATAAAGPSTAP